MLKKISLGWVIMQKITPSYRNNAKLYLSKAVAERYSHGTPVREVFMDVSKEEVPSRIWDAAEWSDETKRSWEEQTGQPADQMPKEL